MRDPFAPLPTLAGARARLADPAGDSAGEAAAIALAPVAARAARLGLPFRRTDRIDASVRRAWRARFGAIDPACLDPAAPAFCRTLAAAIRDDAALAALVSPLRAALAADGAVACAATRAVLDAAPDAAAALDDLPDDPRHAFAALIGRLTGPALSDELRALAPDADACWPLALPPERIADLVAAWIDDLEQSTPP